MVDRCTSMDCMHSVIPFGYRIRLAVHFFRFHRGSPFPAPPPLCRVLPLDRLMLVVEVPAPGRLLSVSATGSSSLCNAALRAPAPAGPEFALPEAPSAGARLAISASPRSRQ